MLQTPVPCGAVPADPVRPRLAPGVRLAGQMREGAYKEPPWLVERAGAGFAQLPELLYRIVERCNGQRSIEDIAGEVSALFGRRVSAANVAYVIRTRLAPARLVVVAAAEPAVSADLRPRSPLALSVRMRLVDPRRFAALIRVLGVAYKPPVLLALLTAAAAAEVWLYLVHGVSASIREALYSPGLLVVVWSGLVLSAAFHELGHATALSYAGAESRGMGFGFYLGFPAFYTDVTANYRLPRWSRLRTDLGGFYFNLLFALAVVALYLWTRREFLLMIVVLTNLEILHQLLPFVRLDGYWVLADLTGIPDFFSLMPAWLRAGFGRAGRRRKTSRLKWWGQAVLVTYACVTLPLLAVLLGMLLFSLPRVVATGWDSFVVQAGAFASAVVLGKVVYAIASMVQACVLLLPMIGMASMLWAVGRGGLGAIWRWGRPTPLRRLTSAAACAALAGLLVAVWFPQLTVFDRGWSPVAASVEALARGLHLHEVGGACSGGGS